MTLGQCSIISLNEAGKIAEEARRLLAEELSPMEKRQQTRKIKRLTCWPCYGGNNRRVRGVNILPKGSSAG